MMERQQQIRFFFLSVIALITWILFSEWERIHSPLPSKSTEALNLEASGLQVHSLPSVSSTETNVPTIEQKGSNFITVRTDILDVKIDLLGGDIVKAELLQYPQYQQAGSQGFLLLDKSEHRDYVAQSGFISPIGPDSYLLGRGEYESLQTTYEMKSHQDTLSVHLLWHPKQATKVQIEKIYTFTKGQYLVDVQYQIHNRSSEPFIGNFYGQIRREPKEIQSSNMLGLQMYQGGALYTPDKPYRKMSFEDMREHPFSQSIMGGWAGMSERYFLAAWVMDPKETYQYFAKSENTEKQTAFQIGAVGPSVTVLPNQAVMTGAKLYIGPELTDNLKKIANGMELTVDYGFLWPISQALFWLLKTIYQFVNNWGLAIILVTLVIKLAFYKLSAASYRSMARLRMIQPKIVAMKERHGEDRQKFSQAMIELYRQEKINPLGGCLPILIQIPVFIALYYVLLESVELRHAPFAFWIQDLASKDPYYVLPILMGLSMIIQQKLSPQPPDPIQAKMMMLMPVIFTVLFIQFPSGLVLYWVVNNVLSILQQWLITKKLNKEGLGVRR